MLEKPKVHILFSFHKGPWGGGNQFLKGLRDYFISKGIYAHEPQSADIILFNSHHLVEVVCRVLRKYPDKIMVHRVDGPLAMVRGTDSVVDRGIFKLNDFIAEGTVFQSKWSQRECIRMGMKEPNCSTIITNAPKHDVFFRKRDNKTIGGKIKLIANSWSANPRKGFDIYFFLDKHLDFHRYKMTFVGNSPKRYNNIRQLQAMKSEQLADEIRKNDIFITASINDPCSNSLIEALHCGLPAVVRDSGGHPEILGKGGTTFTGVDDVCKAIDIVAAKYSDFAMNIAVPSIEETGERYYLFMKQIFRNTFGGKVVKKKLTLMRCLSLYLSLKGARFRSLVDQIRIKKFGHI